jgi:riboflavin kinase/FMN adenylyltransferase
MGDRLSLSLSQPPVGPLAPGASLALGNFDGVHRGHQAVIAAAIDHAAAHGQSAGAVVFEPHPRQVFQPAAPPFRLQSGAQRARALRALGAATVIEIAFDHAFAALTPQAFAEEVLIRRIGIAHVCIGMDFRYGKARAGDAEILVAQGRDLGFAVTVVDAVDDSDHPGDKISSSAVRAALVAGDPVLARRLLGRPFAIEGLVVHGQARGRTIAFPTANIGLGAYVRPALGVYAVEVRLPDGALHHGVANLGVRPTVAASEAEPLLETHLFDFNGDLYGQRLEVGLVGFIRPERKFESFDALTRQIAVDAAEARRQLIGEP